MAANGSKPSTKITGRQNPVFVSPTRVSTLALESQTVSNGSNIMTKLKPFFQDKRVQRGIKTLEAAFVLVGFLFGSFRKASVRIIDNGKSDDVLSFAFNFMALVAVAKELGDALDRAVECCGPSLTSFIGGTGGNVVEIILGIILLIKGETKLLQSSMVGSIAANLLLVLGAAFLVGGLTKTLDPCLRDQEQNQSRIHVNNSTGDSDEQDNNQRNDETPPSTTQIISPKYAKGTAATQVTDVAKGSSASKQPLDSTEEGSQAQLDVQGKASKKTKKALWKIGRGFRYEIFFNTTSSGIFVIYCVFVSFLLLLFSVYMQTASLTGEAKEAAGLSKSRGVAVILLFSYFCLFIFQFVTHKDDFAKLGKQARLGYEPVQEGEQAVPERPGDYGDEEIDSTDWKQLGKKLVPVLGLALLAGGHSEFLSDAVTPFAVALGVSDDFLGFIVIAIVGNAGEHWSAIVMGKQDKMTVAIGIGAGSACQIGGFVFPLLVIIGWFPGVPDFAFPSGILMNLCLVVGAISLNITIQDGSTQYLEGILLILLYVVDGLLLT